MDTELTTDVIVIGGGLAGLTAAAYLARAGIEVTVIERAEAPGGRAASQNHAGYWFNRGAHALYSGGAASEIFRELGITYRHGQPGAISVLRGGQFGALPATPLALLRSRMLDAGDKLELVRMFAALPRLNSRELARRSVQSWLEDTLRRPRTRQLVAATARTLLFSAALDLASAEVLVDKLQRSLKHPVHYIDGGWQTLVGALQQAAERAGARVVTGASVVALEARGGQVYGARLHDGRAISAAAVLVATTPQQALQLIDQQISPELRERVQALVPAQLACLDVALRELPARHHAIVQDLDRPRFLSTQSIYARIAPEGAALVSTFKVLDHRAPSDPRADERELEELLDTAVPGWRDAVARRVYLPHMEASGALPLASQGGFAGRPGPQVPGVENLYLAGDWVGPAGYLTDAAMASARAAALLIARGASAARPAERAALAA